MIFDGAQQRPLVTLAVLAYQQEEFVADAVNGALRQTYHPIEIILSDDCSKDRTFNVMTEVASSYQGQAQVRLNRMEKNVGLVVHLNRVASMAKGSLVVLAAGDDISEPNRVELLVERWARASYSSGSIFSEYLEIREDGTPATVGGLESFRTNDSWMRTVDRDERLFMSYPGCTHAFTPDLFKVFGELEPGIIQEDIYLQLRASLIGGVGFVCQPLVQYRQTKISQSRIRLPGAEKKLAKMITNLLSFLRVLELYEKDCRVALDRNWISQDDYHWAVSAKNKFAEPMKHELRFLQSDRRHRIRMALTRRLAPSIRLRWLLYALIPQIYGWRSR